MKPALSPSVCCNGSEFAEMVRKRCVLPSTHTSPAQHTSCSRGDKPQVLSHPLMAPPSLRSRFAKCVLLPPLKTTSKSENVVYPFQQNFVFARFLCFPRATSLESPMLCDPTYQDTLRHGQVEKSRKPVLYLRAQLS